MKYFVCGVFLLFLQWGRIHAQIPQGSVDSRGAVYSAIRIGKQVWMAENLKTKTFNNGDSIFHARSDEEWNLASYSKIPAWCYYGNDSVKGEEDGVLYNWYAVTDPRGLAPDGWHIPSDSEFHEVIGFLGGAEKAAKKLKSKDAWYYDRGNDQSGFNAKPGGFRFYNGGFANYGYDGEWWTRTENDIDDGYLLSIGSIFSVSISDKGGGHYVRCIRGRTDAVVVNAHSYRSSLDDPIPAYLFQDSAIIEVKIGEQIWMGKNLNVSTFRNGDAIPEAKTNEEWIRAARNKEPAWCYYQNDTTTGTLQGKLYNWYALCDERGLAPLNWRLPSDSDWMKLIETLGESAPTKMKSTFGWKENRKGTNESGFNGIPVGIRTPGGYFVKGGYVCHWWSISDYEPYGRWWTLQNGGIYIERRVSVLPESDGFPVRCVRN